MKAWLNGGLIGVSIALLIDAGLFYSIINSSEVPSGGVFLALILGIPSNFLIIVLLLSFFSGYSANWSLYELSLLSLISIMINGFIIGVIISKIKSKNKKRRG